MLRQWLMKRLKILYGVYRTHLRKDTTPYNPNNWFDAFYAKGVSDRQTIAPDKHALSARYHYASVELIILRHLLHNDFQLEGSRIVDIGSGAGHWLDFYKSLGAQRCVGIDVSQRSVAFLKKKYISEEDIEVHCGLFQDFLARDNREYDIANAIGVLFHVVDDEEWLKGLEAIAASLRSDGLLVVGGHFGPINNINVQFCDGGLVNKRLRSNRRWKRELKLLGFKHVTVHRNRAYLFVKDSLPENNVLIAER